MEEHLRTMLKDAAAALSVTLTEQALDLFGRYYFELLQWNARMNLLSARTAEEIIIKHFVDSLTPLPYLIPCRQRLLDIGSGGGFPGIPLKIALPSLEVSLLESSRKKTSFLRHLIRCLPLTDVEVIHDRVESVMAAGRHHHAFQTVISRAAFKLPVLLKMARFFLAPGGLLIAMKGPLAEAEEPLPTTHFGLRCVARYDLLLPYKAGGRKIYLYQADI